ncbi:unnamed protein product [Calypogeia fissa]
MIAILVVISIIIILFFYDFPDPKSWHDHWRSRSRSRFRAGGQDQVRSHIEEKVPEKQGLFSRVKDNLNFTKHLGFVSDVDSPASQAALAAVREKEEREGVTVEVPQAPLSERLMQGVNQVADTASMIATNASGGVAPRGQESPEEAESEKEPLSGVTEHPESDVSGTGYEVQELSNGPTPKNSVQEQKHFMAQSSDHKEQEQDPPQAAEEKEGRSFSNWARRAAHKLGDAVASKDLTDEMSSLSSKKTTNKT